MPCRPAGSTAATVATTLLIVLGSFGLAGVSLADTPAEVKENAITVMNAHLFTFNLGGSNRTGYDPYAGFFDSEDKLQTESTAMALYYGGVENLGLNATQLQEIYDFFVYMKAVDGWLYSDYTTGAGLEYKKALHNAWSLIAIEILENNGITDTAGLKQSTVDVLEAAIDVNGYMAGDPDGSEGLRTKFIQSLPFMLKAAQDLGDAGAIAKARLAIDFYMANCIDGSYDVHRIDATGTKTLLINTHEVTEFTHGLLLFHDYETDATRKTTIKNNLIGIAGRYSGSPWTYTNSFGEKYVSDAAAAGTVNSLAQFQLQYILAELEQRAWIASGTAIQYMDILGRTKITGTGDPERDNNYYYQHNPDTGAQASANINSYLPGYAIFAVDTQFNTISGSVLEGGSPLAAVDVNTNNGGGSGSTDGSGDYAVLVPHDWTGSVTPTKADYTLAPLSRAYANVLADDAGEDYTATYTPDLTAPTPDPMTWASLPAATSSSSISMTASTATDPSAPVQYFFECTNDGGASSSWQTSPTYEATGLSSSTLYTFRVKTRDSAAAQNESGWSGTSSATTPAPPPMTTYNFSGITSPSGTHLAEDGEIDVADSVIENGTFAGRRNFGSGWANWNEASTAEYAALTGSDNSRYQGADPGFNDNAAMLFTFYVNEDTADVTQVDVSVELGRGASTDLGWVYIWDYNAGAYEVLGSQSGTADQTVAVTLATNAGNYVETGTGQVTIFVANEDTSDWTRVDDISVTVHAASASPVCGNNILEAGESCDDGNTANGDCCSDTCNFESAATVCRASAGACDAAETCSGVDTICPADAFEPVATLCRGSVGVCDAAEVCSGISAFCPVDGFASAATECRASADVCDVAETCSGVDAVCPADGFASAATECRGSAGVCDTAETCSGAGAACPVDGFVAAATECRASAGSCDVAEACTGADAACPTDGFVAAATECRASAGACDVAEACTGGDAACPTDGFVAAATECRASAGDCDVAEACTGGDANCPADGFASPVTTCRPSVGICDATELCTGAAANCPTDEVFDGVPCVDGDVCNGDEMCMVGVCTGGTIPDCDDNDACTADSCDAVSGCTHTPIVPCGAPLPATSAWGQLMLALFVTSLGAMLLAWRRQTEV